MSSQHIGINEARPKLGDLVTAVQQGADIVLTRNGKPAARIVVAKEATMNSMTDAQLAQQHLGYGPGLDEETDAEFWRRQPHLHSWYVAAEWLYQQHVDAIEFDPMGSGIDPADVPGYNQLMTQYRVMVQQIADGE